MWLRQFSPLWRQTAVCWASSSPLGDLSTCHGKRTQLVCNHIPYKNGCSHVKCLHLGAVCGFSVIVLRCKLIAFWVQLHRTIWKLCGGMGLMSTIDLMRFSKRNWS